MRVITLVAVMYAGIGSAHAGDLDIRVMLSGQVAPGVYGQVQIGNDRPPPVVYAQPMLIEPMAAPPPPVYLHVPPGHARNWRKHCHEYHACNRPVYFVRSEEYDPEYQRHYADHERERAEERRRWEDHDREHGNWRDDDEHGHGHGTAMTSTTTKSAGSRLERRARGGPEGEAQEAPSTIDMARRFRTAASGLAVASTLLLTPVIAAHAADDQPKESAISTQAKAFGQAVKRDAKTVGAKSKEGAHRVAVAAKAVGHEVATAAKRSAAATRAAFRGEKSGTPDS